MVSGPPVLTTRRRSDRGCAEAPPRISHRRDSPFRNATPRPSSPPAARPSRLGERTSEPSESEAKRMVACNQSWRWLRTADPRTASRRSRSKAFLCRAAIAPISVTALEVPDQGPTSPGHRECGGVCESNAWWRLAADPAEDNSAWETSIGSLDTGRSVDVSDGSPCSTVWRRPSGWSSGATSADPRCGDEGRQENS